MSPTISSLTLDQTPLERIGLMEFDLICDFPFMLDTFEALRRHVFGVNAFTLGF